LWLKITLPWGSIRSTPSRGPRRDAMADGLEAIASFTFERYKKTANKKKKKNVNHRFLKPVSLNNSEKRDDE